MRVEVCALCDWMSQVKTLLRSLGMGVLGYGSTWVWEHWDETSHKFTALGFLRKIAFLLSDFFILLFNFMGERCSLFKLKSVYRDN